MSGLRHVIFDCDGTLVDSQVIICAAMTRAFESLGLRPPSRDATLSIIGLSLPEAMARLAPGKGAARQAALVQAYKDGFGALRGDPAHHEPLYPGVRTVIDTLAGEPEILLLDEWLAGLNPTELHAGIELIHALRDEGRTIIMVEHVMDAIRSLCDRCVVMNTGIKIADGPPSSVLSEPEVVAAYLGGADA